jgi:hypothetical protein
VTNTSGIPPDAIALWRHLFGDRRDYLGLQSCKRGRDGKWIDNRQEFFSYPDQVDAAAAWAERQVGREVFFCAHLLFDRRRLGENASPMLALYADNDSGEIREGIPAPTARLQSSPGKTHDFWRLSRPIAPQRAEQLNKRMALAMGADPSGFDRSQLLRVIGSTNFKYSTAHVVTIISIDDSITYDPDELDRILPKLPEQERKASGPAAERDIDKADDELLAVMLRSKQGEKIRALLDNDADKLATYPEFLTEGRLDAHKADLSLCNSLAFYLGTAERADAAFRRSKRMRDKWDAKHRGDGATYGEMTLEKAFAGRTEFYTPPGEGPDLADALDEGQAAVHAAEHIVKGDDSCRDCPRHCAETARLQRVIEAQQQVIADQRATIAQYNTIQRQEREIFASSLPPAQKLADWAILNVVTARTGRSDEEQPLYADEVAQLCNVSRDTIGKRLEAQAALGVFTKTTKWDTARLVVNEKTGEMRPPLVTRVKPLVSASDAWSMVAQAAASAPARKRAPSRCPVHPSAPVQRMCLAPVGERVCGLILSPEPMYTPTADVGVDPVPEVLPQESAIHPGHRKRGYSVPLLPQESAIPEDLEPTVEGVLGGPDAPIGEPPEEPPDDETRERWRLEHYRERYDHAPSAPASGRARTNGTNGHHPPPPVPDPLRMTSLEIIELLQAKYGPSPPAHNDTGEAASL